VISTALAKLSDTFLAARSFVLAARSFVESLRAKRGSRSFENYEQSLPSHQNAIDAISGWNSAFPPHLDLRAGNLPLYDDDRIRWAIACFGDLSGRRVLELGPLEAGHTAMLHAAGAHVVAIEANKLAFSRCLVAKEILGLNHACFFLGDFVKWLEQKDTTYDLIVASGMLYHMKDPLRLLCAMARRTDTIYLWTVCVGNDAIPPTMTRTMNGIPVRLYQRAYSGAEENVSFCGGMEDRPFWLHREDILAVLKSLGFTDMAIAHDDPEHLFGPSFSVFARKPAARALVHRVESPGRQEIAPDSKAGAYSRRSNRVDSRGICSSL
jgi:hypothetical protein